MVRAYLYSYASSFALGLLKGQPKRLVNIDLQGISFSALMTSKLSRTILLLSCNLTSTFGKHVPNMLARHAKCNIPYPTVCQSCMVVKYTSSICIAGPRGWMPKHHQRIWQAPTIRRVIL